MSFSVLIADKLDPVAEAIFKQRGIHVDKQPGLDETALISIIDKYDGVAVRSATKITAPVIGAGKKLRVIGRAGIGVDTIDVPAATKAGVAVMNTPFGNSITTAEHAIAMMFALARQIPQASESTHAGKWEKSRFMGVELYGKVLGVVGCGNIGSIVANRALGLQMRVIAYDPYLTDDRATELGVEKADLDTVLRSADFITLHVPKTESTTNLLNSEALAKTKKGVRIINCARGGLIDEEALKEALDSGQVAGAALDVFLVEPAKENVLFNHPNVICTPHLGASTDEAQVNVAVQIAEQMSDFLLLGAVSNAVNTPAVTAEEAPRLKPWINLSTQLGELLGQIAPDEVESFELEVIGEATELSIKPLLNASLAAYLKNQSDSVNMVNAPEIARVRGIQVSSTSTENAKTLPAGIRLSVKGKKGEMEVVGTLFAGQHARVVRIGGVPIECALTGNMLFVRNHDQPGLIGAVGTILGEAGVNIADFRLGRVPEGSQAICLVTCDGTISDDVYKQISALEQAVETRRLHFSN